MTGPRFVVLADPQLGCLSSLSGLGPEARADYAARGMQVPAIPKVEGHDEELARLHTAVDAINTLRPDLVVVAGDLVHDSTDVGQVADVLAAVDRVDAGITVHWLPGNHDVTVDGVTVDAEALTRYRRRFGPDWFSESLGGWWFVGLDTSLLGHPGEALEAADDQWAFFDATLEVATADRAQGIVLFGHHPVFVVDHDEPDDFWNLPGPTRRRVLARIAEHGVTAGFAGHLHRNARARYRGFDMVTVGAVGCPLGDDPPGYLAAAVVDGTLTHEYHRLGASVS